MVAPDYSPQTGKIRARRSALYVPANNVRALAKAPSLSADVLIYDLEDAVLDDQKALARDALSTHVPAHYPGEMVLRTNPVRSTAFAADIQWLSDQDQVDAVLLPKVRNKAEVDEANALLEGAGFDKPIWLLIETVDAILNLGELVTSLHRNAALVLGAEDLACEMRINQTPGRLGLLPVLTQLVLYARSAGLSVIDGVYTDLGNQQGFCQSCEQARNLGFDGKSLVHPDQVAPANQYFSPSIKEIDNAQKIIAAWDQRRHQQGVVLNEGKVIEQLHVKQARELIQRAQYLAE